MDGITFNCIKNKLQSDSNIDRQDYEMQVLMPFLKAMGYIEQTGKWEITDNYRYDYIYDDMILFRYYPKADIDIAVMESEKELEQRKSYEWEILFHRQGIWLFNRDIAYGRMAEEKDKVVLSVLFSNNRDRAYLEYMSYDNLIGSRQDAKYFADITEYKNLNYADHNEASWVAYVSALKRFLSYCSQKGLHYSNTEYTNIRFHNFEHYVKTSSKIKSENAAKAQFFYIKGFMKYKTGVDGDFDRSSADILSRCGEILREENKEFTDIKPAQVEKLIDALSDDRHGVRNITLLLLLMGMGTERKRICDLRWDKDISRDMTLIRIRETDNDDEKVIIPKILAYYLKQLRMLEPDDAIYVFGNWSTEYQVPVKEGSINGMLDSITNNIKNDTGINMITPGTLRRWLFLYLLKCDYRLQDIMCMMNISVDNLGNYISDLQLKKFSSIYDWKNHPLDDEQYFKW